MRYFIRFLNIFILFGLLTLIPLILKWSHMVIIIRTCLIFLLLIEILRTFKNLFYDKLINEKIRTFMLFGFSMMLCFLLLEEVFMFIPKSHGVGDTISSQNWFNYYWHPINSYGYRDVEPKNNGNQTYLFVGDSFTQGHGIKSVSDRFSNIVGANLKAINCINLGKNGRDTQQEFKIMTEFVTKSQIKPSKIILQYFGNDIETIAFKNGLKIDGYTTYCELNEMSKKLVQGFAIINYFYWIFPKGDSKAYLNLLTNAYQSPKIFEEHTNDLMKFIEYAKSTNTELIVVCFPFMNNVALSNELYTNKIINFLKINNVKTIDVGNLVLKNKITDLIINNNDAHASVTVNKLVGNAILNELQKN